MKLNEVKQRQHNRKLERIFFLSGASSSGKTYLKNFSKSAILVALRKHFPELNPILRYFTIDVQPAREKIKVELPIDAMKKLLILNGYPITGEVVDDLAWGISGAIGKIFGGIAKWHDTYYDGVEFGVELTITPSHDPALWAEVDKTS